MAKEYIERNELTLFLRNEIVECETALNNMETPYEHQLEEEAVSGRMQAMVDVWRKVTNKAPADVVEVVRCKDCIQRNYHCFGQYYCQRYLFKCKENDYCSYGERKEGAENG